MHIGSSNIVPPIYVSPYPYIGLSLFPPPPAAGSYSSTLCFSAFDLFFIPYISDTVHYLSFSFSIVTLSFIHVDTIPRISFIFMAK